MGGGGRRKGGGGGGGGGGGNPRVCGVNAGAEGLHKHLRWKDKGHER